MCVCVCVCVMGVVRWMGRGWGLCDELSKAQPCSGSIVECIVNNSARKSGSERNIDIHITRFSVPDNR